jgi:hypothetical protein
MGIPGLVLVQVKDIESLKRCENSKIRYAALVLPSLIFDVEISWQHRDLKPRTFARFTGFANRKAGAT